MLNFGFGILNRYVMELEQQTKFDLLVRQLERSTRQRNTTDYQLKVAALATIGYGYIGAWLAARRTGRRGCSGRDRASAGSVQRG